MLLIFIDFLAMLTKQPITFFRGPVIGRNDEEPGKRAYIEQEF
jgi:hypothetical protein